MMVTYWDGRCAAAAGGEDVQILLTLLVGVSLGLIRGHLLEPPFNAGGFQAQETQQGFEQHQCLPQTRQCCSKPCWVS